MVSGPISSQQIDGETMETLTDVILGGSKITADGDCNHEIKTRLLFGRKAMTNLLLGFPHLDRGLIAVALGSFKEEDPYTS